MKQSILIVILLFATFGSLSAQKIVKKTPGEVLEKIVVEQYEIRTYFISDKEVGYEISKTNNLIYSENIRIEPGCILYYLRSLNDLKAELAKIAKFALANIIRKDQKKIISIKDNL
ncbi:MAG: hypothetical protein KGZ74_14520 [Chitinophagaceae bacterium]|nr:hypothetical protein [Chitinophagaceae bacterium]